MDVALAQTILSSRAQAAQQDAQISVLKKSMDTESAAVGRLLEAMSLPLATEGSLGTHVNAYA